MIGLSTRFVGLEVPRRVGPNEFVDINRWRPDESVTRLEADERIYIALVEQLEAGRGYTLQGHPILNDPVIAGPQYGRALFFHPPGGIAFFWLMHQLAGESGFALAQTVSFAIFFWSLILLGDLTARPFGGAAAVLLAVLAAFTPIMAHVSGRLWLDAPLLAFATAASAVFLRGVTRGRMTLVGAAGLLLGAASWIKLTAFLAAPGAIALALAVTPKEHRRALIGWAVTFVGLAIVIQLPWEIWQWQVLGTAFPGWAGRPVQSLVDSNSYVRYLTVIRSPWIYFTVLPQVLWTLVPALILTGVQWRDRELRARALALCFWIIVVSGAHVALGLIGYSRVLRYAILVTPAVALLFAMAASSVFTPVRAGAERPGSRIIRALLVVLALAGLGLELTQSMMTTFVDNASHDLVKPLTGFRDLPR